MKSSLRRKGVRWIYDGDGLFPTERIKGIAKRYWRRWRRKQNRKLEPDTKR